MPLPFLVAWVVSVTALLAATNQHLRKGDDTPNPESPQETGSNLNEDAVSDEFDGAILPPPDRTPDALHWLPLPPADFIGRQPELENLLKAVETESVIICGPAGVGKTALALKLAEGLKPSYPDAQIYLDLGRQEAVDKPLAEWQALAQVIHAFRPEVELPEEQNELGKLYRSLLEGQNALLVLDNADSTIPLESLLPPTSCRLIVTALQNINLAGLHSVQLDVLPEDQAAELVEKITAGAGNSTGESAGQIAELCGGLPLALRAAAGTMACQADLWGPDLIDALAKEQESANSGSVEACLQVGYDHLEDGLEVLWRLLAVFPGSFDMKAAVAIWHVDAAPSQEDPDELQASYRIESEPAQEALDQLAARGLLEYDPASRRYRLHELLRRFALQKVNPQELRQVARQQAFYFANILKEAEQLFLEDGKKRWAGLALFDLEWDNIRTGQMWAASNSELDADAARLCIDYPDYGEQCLNLRLIPPQWIEWIEAAEAAAHWLGDTQAESSSLNSLGHAYEIQGKLERARQYYEQDLKVNRENFDRRGEGIALTNLGNIDYQSGELDRAISRYEQALQIQDELVDLIAEGTTLSSLGLVSLRLGKLPKAIEYFEQAVQIERTSGDASGEAADLANLGSAYGASGQPHRASECYEQARQIHHALSDRQGEANDLDYLGTAYRDLGDTLQAMDYHRQALRIFRELGDRSGEANTGWNLGLMLEKSGEYIRAAELMQVTVDYLHSTDSPEADEKAARLEEVKDKANQ
ncbi:MAG: tetratricopeptide repeat protein [Anaerolineaceae bacterium]|nr:tetratricopeptide repeat protein [Anaerolineaceae bacterium]